MTGDNKTRIGIIGARRVHQGLGPYVARFLVQAGAQVPAILGTRDANNQQTQAHLQNEYGMQCAAYTDFKAMAQEQNLDAVAILCPPEHHLAYLRQAAELGLHTLCEKPLALTGQNATTGVAEALAAFDQRGLWLEENCQWPHVLPAFWRLHPDAGRRPETFHMGMSPSIDPSAPPVRMAIDSASHPLSLLEALAPGPAQIQDATVEGTPWPGKRLLRFQYRPTDGPPVSAAVHLQDSPERPRPAWLEIDGLRADRLIRSSDYAIFLIDGSRQEPVRDPLQVHLEGFLETLDRVRSGAAPPPAARLWQRAQNLQTLLQAFPQDPH